MLAPPTVGPGTASTTPRSTVRRGDGRAGDRRAATGPVPTTFPVAVEAGQAVVRHDADEGAAGLRAGAPDHGTRTPGNVPDLGVQRQLLLPLVLPHLRMSPATLRMIVPAVSDESRAGGTTAGNRPLGGLPWTGSTPRHEGDLQPPVAPHVDQRETFCMLRVSRGMAPGVMREDEHAGIWSWSDLHLGHTETLHAFGRPFETAARMDTRSSGIGDGWSLRKTPSSSWNN